MSSPWSAALTLIERESPSAPSWMAAIDTALTNAAPLGDGLEASFARAPNNHQRGCLRLVAPLTRELATRVERALASHVVPMDRERVLGSILDHVSSLVSAPLSRTTAVEVHVARSRGLLQGDTPEARFDFFIDAMSDPEVLPSFWGRHPVLARHVWIAIESYANAVIEMLEGLAEQWSGISSVLLGTVRTDDRLVAIHARESETHRAGRVVMVLEWASGARVVYKPRSAECDRAYAMALAWISERAPMLAVPRSPLVVSNERHSFHEMVPERRCASREQLVRYYERQGVHLALLFMLHARDMHAENVIVSGEHPVLIDLEAVLQPELGAKAPPESSPAQSFLERSVLAPLFLPMRLAASDESSGVDISAIGARSGQRTPVKGVVMTQLGTDEVKAALAHDDVSSLGLRPGIDGVEADPADFEADVLRGFHGAWGAIASDRVGFADGPLEAFRDVSVRVLARSTDYYNALFERSYHPANLDDGLARERVFDLLERTVPDSPHLAHLIASERADLHQTDVPFFTMRPSTRDLLDSRGLAISGLIASAPFELARSRVLGLSDDERERQTWIVHASFASMTTSLARESWKPTQTDLPPAPIDPASLLARARRIAERIEALAIRDRERVGWLTLDIARGRDWIVTPADADLYGGSPGIALFLARFAEATGQTRFAALARQAIGTFLPALERKIDSPQPVGIGMSGVSGALYALSHLAVALADPSLASTAARLAKKLRRHIDADPYLDVLEGSAGCLLALHAVHRVHPDEEVLELATRCAARLREASKPVGDGVAWSSPLFESPMTGLGHGASGIALSLLRHATLAADRSVLDLARSAFSFERPHLRDASSIQGICHGAPGIALVRREARGILDDAEIHSDLSHAVETTIREGFGQNHSLCHGDFGNLEVLFDSAEARRDRLARLCASIDREGWRSGNPNGVQTPSLFTGLCGIGYQLVRHAYPIRIPSLVTFSSDELS